jgi:hypothetical protein
MMMLQMMTRCDKDTQDSSVHGHGMAIPLLKPSPHTTSTAPTALTLTRSTSHVDQALHGGPLSPFMDVLEEDDYLVGRGSDLETVDTIHVKHDVEHGDENVAKKDSIDNDDHDGHCNDVATVTTEAMTDSEPEDNCLSIEEKKAQGQTRPQPHQETETTTAATTAVTTSTTKNNTKKSVRFGAVRVQEHSVILGDHPLCQMLPLSLGWCHAAERVHPSIHAHHDFTRRSKMGHYSSSCPTIAMTSLSSSQQTLLLREAVSSSSSSTEEDNVPPPPPQDQSRQGQGSNTTQCCSVEQPQDPSSSLHPHHVCCNLNCNQFRQGLSWPSSTKRLTYNERKVLLKRLSGLGDSDLMRLERHRRRMAEHALQKQYHEMSMR